jgi:hypothetical protein
VSSRTVGLTDECNLTVFDIFASSLCRTSIETS